MKIKLGLAKKTAAQKVQLAKNIETGLTDNPNFTEPDPTILEITAKREKTQTAIDEYEAALDIASTKFGLLKSAEADLEQVINQEANYVENKSAGDIIKIKSAGFDVTSDKTPSSVPAQVLITSIIESQEHGKLFLKWKKANGAKTYKIEKTTTVEDPATWTEVDTITKTKLTVTGLTSGTKYWFRVQGIGPAGKGAFSDPAVKYAP